MPDIDTFLANSSDRDLVRATLFMKHRAVVAIRTCFRRGMELSRNQRVRLALAAMMQKTIDTRRFGATS